MRRLLGGTDMPRFASNTRLFPIAISPLEGVSKPAMHLRVVVLPQPLGPRRVKSLPAGTVNETPSTALTSFAPSRKTLLRSVALITVLTLVYGKLARKDARAQRHDTERADEQHAERGQLREAAGLIEAVDHHREHFRAQMAE